MVHGVAVHISYRSVSGGARCFLSSLVRRSRLSAPTEPFQASLKTRPCRVAGTLWRRFLWVMWLACSLVRVRWNISAFAVCSWCSWSYTKVPRNAAEERRRGRNGGTTFRLDSLGTLVYGVNIFLLIEIFTL